MNAATNIPRLYCALCAMPFSLRTVVPHLLWRASVPRHPPPPHSASELSAMRPGEGCTPAIWRQRAGEERRRSAGAGGAGIAKTSPATRSECVMCPGGIPTVMPSITLVMCSAFNCSAFPRHGYRLGACLTGAYFCKALVWLRSLKSVALAPSVVLGLP
ncbi:hypothetical protein BD626DRAFT_171076 [Schizophyllum amplum]|uniref:Uncharacterized protein n=1 Tax=Schizophyllum amplum TaxID=97359 RepID=A0A550CR12_9AGAR|nr:hypothetical protein BD626DRAFT_171076 [Auriculariopsis ampla]